MKRFTFLITLFTLFSTLNAQDLHWAFNIGNTAPDEADVVSEIATDAAGNVYATGYFRSTADFDPDPAATHNLVSHGLTDIYVAKYTSAGALVWAFSIGSGWFDSGAGIDLDSEGNVYVTGSFEGANVDFDPAPGSSHLLSVNGGEDIFIAKYDNDGNFLWAHHTGSTGGNEGGADILADGVALRTAFEGPEWKVQPYPNPVKDQLSYQITAPQGSQVLLRLLDLTGRVVRSERLTLDSPFWEGELNTFDLQTGVYILEVQTETQRQTVKLVKE